MGKPISKRVPHACGWVRRKVIDMTYTMKFLLFCLGLTMCIVGISQMGYTLN